MSDLLRRFLWAAYDHLGGLVLLNLLWTGLSLPWLLLAVLLVGWGGGMGGGRVLIAGLLSLELVLCSPPTLLLFLAGRRWARDEEASPRELFDQWQRFAWRAQRLGLLVMGATLGLLVNVFFYRQFAGWGGLVLSGVMLWLLLAVGLIAVYLFPVLLSQDGGVWQTARQSLLLATDNIGISLGLLLVVALVLAVGAFSGLGLFCGLLAGLALFICVCFGKLLAKYTGEVPSAGPRRSWRELIRPWDT